MAGCLNGEVHVFSNLTHALSSTLRVPRSQSISALKTNPLKRNYIIGGSNEGMVVVWDTNVNRQKFFVESHKAPVTGVAFSPNNPDLIISTGTSVILYMILVLQIHKKNVIYNVFCTNF